MRAVEQHRLRTARRGIVAAWLCALGSAVASLIIFRQVPTVTSWQWWQLIVASTVLTALLSLRRAPSLRLCGAFLVAGTTSMLVAVWVNNAELATSPTTLYEPFLGYRLAALALAMLAPGESWAGLVSISACGVAPVLEYYWLPDAARAHVGVQGPWIAAFHAAVATGIFLYRLRTAALERRIMEAGTQRAAQEHLARMSLAVRDLANSPLQAIAMTAGLLRSRHPETADLVARIERSMDRLNELSRVLAAYEAQRPWQPGDESFDAISMLERGPTAAPPASEGAFRPAAKSASAK